MWHTFILRTVVAREWLRGIVHKLCAVCPVLLGQRWPFMRAYICIIIVTEQLRHKHCHVCVIFDIISLGSSVEQVCVYTPRNSEPGITGVISIFDAEYPLAFAGFGIACVHPVSTVLMCKIGD